VSVWPHPAVDGATVADALGAPGLVDGAVAFGSWHAAATRAARTRMRRIVRKPKRSRGTLRT
jgi:hypothetical protein